MPLAQRTPASDDQPLRQPAPAAHAHNVIPFPSLRLLLPVTLVRTPPDTARHAPSADLAAVLHSPLGVYVIDTAFVRDGIRVLFDIAPEDLDFTLHTLIGTLPRAVIGRVTKRRTSVESGSAARSSTR